MVTPLRPDLHAIAELIAPNATVLDVGCGEGELLAWLQQNKNVKGRGVELSQAGVNRCIGRGLAVIQGDADLDLSYYPDGSFDYAILSQTLQTLRRPREVLEQLVRIAGRAIVSVPNFGHWRNRLYLLLHGRMPVTHKLPYSWYDTPNIHFCTISDFVELCEELGLVIEERLYVNAHGEPYGFRNQSWLANVWGEQGVFVVRRRET